MQSWFTIARVIRLLKFDRPKTGSVRAKICLTGQRDGRLPVSYLQPWQPVRRLLYGYGTSSILSNIKNATGNIAGTLDDFGSGSDENKNMYKKSELDE